MTDEAKKPVITGTDKMLRNIGAAVMFISGILLLLPLRITTGAIAGYISGLLFGDYVLKCLAEFGVHGITMAQLGATLGFAAAFLRTQVEVRYTEGAK